MEIQCIKEIGKEKKVLRKLFPKSNESNLIILRRKELIKMNDEKLNEVINNLYKKIEDGTMEQDSIELLVYMWLSELMDRRKQDKSVLEISELLKDIEYVVIRQYKNGELSKEERIEVDEVAYSEYAERKVIEIHYSIDLVKSCETTIEITPILIVK